MKKTADSPVRQGGAQPRSRRIDSGSRADRGDPALEPRQWAFDHWDLVDRLARRRFASEALAEEAALYVMDRLAADDWRCLRSYSGRAGRRTYFVSVVHRQLEDFARIRFGRLRPPGWVAKLGGIWMVLYRLMCLERRGFAEAVMIAETRYPDIRVDRIEAAAEKIVGDIPSCGSGRLQEQPYDDEVQVSFKAGDIPAQQAHLETRERHHLFEAVSRELFGAAGYDRHGPGVAALAAVSLTLTAEERLLLKLCHRDGLSVTKSARMLGLSRFQAHGKLRRLYARIRREFERVGLGAELKQFLQS